MRESCPAPLERLAELGKQVGLDQADMDYLGPFAPALAAHGDEFSRAFGDYFGAIDSTRLILENTPEPQRLAKTLARWFSDLFTLGPRADFLARLWDSGVRHVELSLDQRYVNLGYCLARKFCHQLVRGHVPEPEQAGVMRVVDKLLDLCILVATDSFVTCTSRCDLQVIAGIAHQVRNPVTVIGGSINRLRRKGSGDDRAERAFSMIQSENRRLERMLEDVVAYTDLYQTEPRFEPCDIAAVADEVCLELAKAHGPGEQWLTAQFSPGYTVVSADRGELELLLFHLLENALEASPPPQKTRLTTGPGTHQGFITLAVANSAEPPPMAEIDSLFQPFNSSKPMGTGFGLPIARLVARRNMGSLSLGPAPGGGTLCAVQLLRPKAQRG